MTTDKTDHADNDWVPLSSGNSRKKSAVHSGSRNKRWSLVLTAMGIEHRSERSLFGWKLLVHSADFEMAQAQIRQFELENRDWPPQPPPTTLEKGSPLVTLSVILLVASFHNLIQSDSLPAILDDIDWREIGMLYAGKVRNGEIWRTITALTLHSDVTHILGNAAVSFLFVEQLRKVYGSGFAWALFLASGICGNLLNAMLQPYHHMAVGASTAVFGLLGVIAADSFVRFRAALLRRWLQPIAGAVALLAFLGSSGENTDLGAHLWGFACGLPIGYLFAKRQQSPPVTTQKANRLLAVSCIVVVCGAWMVGFLTS